MPVYLQYYFWLFGTVYWPADREQPERLGFDGMEDYPRGVPGRLVYPLRVPRRSRR